ncbi:uncharacterized protein LOC125374725 [Haliotis rufescens]|uniref:uncharacterized protein LOC125374725 n=1 Tax=Haliotis rufescens TaxID=6454 RepID=UPI00201F0F95|nr:uncharacterized protein LOC125374725 [Haliotis rufescens]
MKDEASEYFASCIERDPDIPFEDLVKKFQRWYDRQELPETAQVKFNTMRQQPDESLEKWSERLTSTATIAFDRLPEDYVERQVIMRFCLGCEQKEAGQYAANLHPFSLEKAMDAVRTFQHTHQAIYGKPRQIRYLASDREEGGDFQVRAVSRSPVSNSRTPTLEKKMDQLEARFDKMETMLFKVMGRFSNRRSRSPSPATSPGRSNKCYQCGQVGHFKINCPQRSPIKDKRVTFREEQSSGEKELNSNGVGRKA